MFSKLPLRDKILRILAISLLLGAVGNVLVILLGARDMQWLKIIEGLIWITLAAPTGWGILKRMLYGWYVGFVFIAFMCISVMVRIWVDWAAVQPKVPLTVPIFGSVLFAGLFLTFAMLWLKVRGYFISYD